MRSSHGKLDRLLKLLGIAKLGVQVRRAKETSAFRRSVGNWILAMAETRPLRCPKRDDSFKCVANRLQCDPDQARFEAPMGKPAKAKPVAAKKGR
jgi:hypothetical protein